MSPKDVGAVNHMGQVVTGWTTAAQHNQPDAEQPRSFLRRLNACTRYFSTVAPPFSARAVKNCLGVHAVPLHEVHRERYAIRWNASFGSLVCTAFPVEWHSKVPHYFIDVFSLIASHTLSAKESGMTALHAGEPMGSDGFLGFLLFVS
jgi:hypothetical protein